ncbi:MAG: hypothetical protein JXN64_07585 [Spirochaetes bacterium]|nr:hypothetical protein [Spirochaetota bacterium]
MSNPVKLKIIIFFIIYFLSYPHLFAEIFTSEHINSITIQLDQYIDLANLEYDDHPYPGRTNLGHIFIPYLQVSTAPLQVNAGGWYKHIYVQYGKDKQPEKMYPYINAVFFPWNDSEFIIGNFPNLMRYSNTIYNEFLFFEQRPVSSGLKFTLHKKTIDVSVFLDWIRLDTEEHPEEFTAGLLLKHNFSEYFYYKFFDHYHHKGGQLNKDTHPVRIEQDIVNSPVLGFIYKGFFIEAAYYLSTFSQNFEASTYGHAGSGMFGYSGNSFELSYQCFYNHNYFHQDSHIFYLKRKNFLNRIRFDYNLLRYKEIVDVMFTSNLYGMEPPGIDFRLFAKISLNIIGFANDSQDKFNNIEKDNSAGNEM